MTSHRRIWSELVPLDELARADILGDLAARGVQLLVAVQPGQLEGARAVVERAHELSLSVGLWPLLDDAAGRWLNPTNAPAFEGWIERLMDELDARGLSVDTLALDLEPPIDEVRGLLDGRWRAGLAAAVRRRLRLRAAADAALVEKLRARGVETLAAVVPAAVADGQAGRGWQRLLGSPLDGIPYDTVTSMIYTSLFEGYSRGLLRRRDARALLGRFAGSTRARLGGRASVSLGAVGVGALGDERTYRSPAELADDVGLARAAGVDDLGLFDLSGVLARPPAEAWLDAFTRTPASSAPARLTPRARLVDLGVHVVGFAAGLG